MQKEKSALDQLMAPLEEYRCKYSGCRKLSAWRCASDQGLGILTCNCKCHREKDNGREEK